MENNNKTLLIVGLIVLAGGIYFTFLRGNDTQSNLKAQPTPTPTQVAAEPTPMPTVNTENQGKYIIKSGQASYTVMKQFVGKDAGKVTGTTSAITGKGEYNEEKGTMELKADVDLSTLKTDSDMRDGDVQKIFAQNKTATFMVSDLAVKKDAKIDTTVKGNLTINGVTKPVDFKVIGTWDEKTINVEGMTNILMTDYNVTPPSRVGVFTVAPETEIKFNVVAELN